MVRAFIALELNEEAKKEIIRIQKVIWKKTLFSGKLTESENLHLTLKFLGEINEEQVEIVKQKLNEIKISKFFAEIGEVGVFSKDFIKIIWVKLNGKGIWDLQKEIDDKLSDLFAKEERFMSHITIARVKNVRDKKGFLEYLKSIKLRKIKFQVNKFYFKKSELYPEGPRYDDLGEYILEK